MTNPIDQTALEKQAQIQQGVEELLAKGDSMTDYDVDSLLELFEASNDGPFESKLFEERINPDRELAAKLDRATVRKYCSAGETADPAAVELLLAYQNLRGIKLGEMTQPPSKSGTMDPAELAEFTAEIRAIAGLEEAQVSPHFGTIPNPVFTLSPEARASLIEHKEAQE